MAKRNLNRRQQWRIDQIQKDKAKRLAHRQQKVEGLLGDELSGRVIAHYGQHLDIEDAQQQVHRCHVRANLPTVVTGDKVVWQAAPQQQGVVVALLPRDTVLSRPDSRGQLKMLAANISQIVIVSAALPAPQPFFIDRYLVAAEHAGFHPLLVLNKSDLINADNQDEMQTLNQRYEKLGYRVLTLSAKENQHLDSLKQQLEQHISVFVGQSGVGKSSLIAELLPHEDLRVGELSTATSLGKHTTTTAKLFHFPGGGALIDSPGIRDYTLNHLSQHQIASGFVEFQPYLGLCKYRDCSHSHEPHCALIAAAENGEINQNRLKSFYHIVQQPEL